MEQQKIDLFIATNSKYFPGEKMGIIKDRLEKMDDSRLVYISSIEYKDPTTLLLISIFVGVFGVDRFMLGEIGMGMLKLFTGGLCGILTVIDWFTISKKAKAYNFQRFIELS